MVFNQLLDESSHKLKNKYIQEWIEFGNFLKNLEFSENIGNHTKTWERFRIIFTPQFIYAITNVCKHVFFKTFNKEF